LPTSFLLLINNLNALKNWLKKQAQSILIFYFNLKSVSKKKRKKTIEMLLDSTA